MNTNSSRKNNSISLVDFLYLSAYLLLIILYSYWSSEVYQGSITSNYEHVIFPWIIISFVLTLIGFIFIYKTPLSDIALWFILVSYLFMFGHIFLKVFDLETSLIWNPGTFFMPDDKIKGAIYALLSLNFTSLGYFIHNSFRRDVRKRLFNEHETNLNMFNVGLIIFIIGFLCTIINNFIIVTSTYKAGSYVAYATLAGSTGFLDDFAYLIIPGVTFMLTSRKMSHNTAKVFTVLMCLMFLVIMVFSGSRKTQLFSILTIFICYRWVYGKHKIKPTSTISVSILGFLLLNLIYIIREYRTNLAQILPEFIKSIENFDFIKKIFGETFAETGLSMYSVVSIVKYVPSVFHYEYGLTFFRAVLAILPLGSLFPTFFSKGFSTFLINKYTGIPVGSSLIGDFYWNFGLIGALIVSFFFGILLSKVGTLKYNNNYSEPIYFSILFIIFIGIRAGIMDITRPLIIITVIPLLLKKLLLYMRKR